MDGYSGVHDVRHSSVRTLVVLALATLLLAINATSLIKLFGGMDTFGLYANGSYLEDVGAGSPADRAGVRKGDRIDLNQLSPEGLRNALSYGAVARGQTLDLPVIHQGQHHTIRLVSAPFEMSSADKAVLVLRLVLALLFITLGAAAVLRRPSVATWGFFFYCLGLDPGSSQAAYALAPPALFIPLGCLIGVLNAAGLVGLLAFSLYFPRPSPGKWRTWLVRALPYIFVPLALLAIVPVIDIRGDSKLWSLMFLVAGLAVVCLAFWMFVDSLRKSQGVARQQVEWVLFGFAISTIAEVIAFVVGSPILPVAMSSLSTQLLILGFAAGPLAVSYAIFRHHILGLDFVISRTLAYAVITALLVALFSLLDLLLHSMIITARLALVAELGAAIAVGFWINSFHHRVDRFIDRTLFRSRYEAERRLDRAARGLAHATSIAAIDRILVTEPVEALRLASAAIFHRRAESFARGAADGWNAGTSTALDANDPLSLHLQGKVDALRVSEVGRTSLSMPDGFARPVIALPIVLRHELVGIELFGAHAFGEFPDPAEIAALQRLLESAAAAYDAVALRERCRLLESELEAHKIAVPRA